MSNRRKAKRPDLGGLDLGGLDFALAQAFRRSCNECGSADLHWFAGTDAAEVLGSETALSIVGWLSAVEAADTHWWRCLTCGNAGMFGGVEFWE